jgi:hypothetical protein
LKESGQEKKSWWDVTKMYADFIQFLAYPIRAQFSRRRKKKKKRNTEKKVW